jgi:hypothetical protein
MNTYRSGGIAPPFLTSVLELTGQFHVPVALPPPPRRKSPRYPLAMRLGGPRSGEVKNIASAGNPTLVVQRAGRRYTDCAIPAPDSSVREISLRAHKAGWQSGNALDPYSEGTRFETPSKHELC